MFLTLAPCDLITWLDPDMPREKAIEQAVWRTNRALKGRISSSPLMERVHRIRDIIIEHSKLRKLVSFTYGQNKLDCTPYQAEHAMGRSLQLYPDLKELKLFNNYRYYYHTSLAEEDPINITSLAFSYCLLQINKGCRRNRYILSTISFSSRSLFFLDRCDRSLAHSGSRFIVV